MLVLVLVDVLVVVAVDVEVDVLVVLTVQEPGHAQHVNGQAETITGK